MRVRKALNVHRRQCEKQALYNWAGIFLCYPVSNFQVGLVIEQSTIRGMLTSGDSSERITAPLVSTWITLAEGNEGLAMAERKAES